MKEATLTFTPTFQEQPLAITGDLEVVQDIHADLQAQEAALLARQPKAAEKPVEVPKTRPEPQNAYIDTNTLEPKELLRRKISAWVYDRKHGTRMLDLLNEKINDDRDVAYAQRLGLISTVHCVKHQKAVAKLKGMVI